MTFQIGLEADGCAFGYVSLLCWCGEYGSGGESECRTDDCIGGDVGCSDIHSGPGGPLLETKTLLSEKEAENRV